VPETLRPYVPRLAVEWLRRGTSARYRRAEGTLVFADISGFTSLTERLGRRGKAGAEEMADILNDVFAQLLSDAYDYGASLLKWGGDAGLLFFDATDGDNHAARAGRAAWEMQRTIRRCGRVRTAVGSVTLRMSIGIDSGLLDVFMVGSRHTELLAVGPLATNTAAMEQIADATQIVIASEDGHRLLTTAPCAEKWPHREAGSEQAPELAFFLPPTLAPHLAAGPIDPEHRPVATAFVSFSGTDALIAAGQTGVVADGLAALVDAADDECERHGVTFLASDIGKDGGKLMLVAGAPGSQGDCEQRLLGAVRAIVDTPSPFALRGGVTRGRVFAGDFGPSFRRTYSVVGDSVNLAARLMASAQPGHVVTTPDVVEHAGGRFPTVALPPLTLKGKSEPVQAVVVTGPPVAAVASAGQDSPFVGRDNEIVALLSALHSARAGEGRAIEIVADTGMGKTRLVSEFCRGLDDVHAVACDLYGTTTPYAPIRALLRSVLGDRDVEDVVSTSVPEVMPWLPLIGAVAGVEVAMTPEVDALDERFRVARQADAIIALLAALLDRPAVLVVDDAHLAGKASADLLLRLSEAAPGHPWLVVITRKPDESDQSFVEDAALWLTPLDDDAATVLLEALTDDAPIPEHELVALRDQAAGNPLYLCELAAARMEAGELAGLPATVEALVATQIDRLPPAGRRLLRAASVLGVECDRQVLEALLDDRVSAPAWASVAALLAAGDGGRTLRFRHGLVQETAYERLPYRQRARLHALAAEAIERFTGADDDMADVLSLHWLRAQRADRALPYARRAAQRAAARYATLDAAELYERALECALRCEDGAKADVVDLALALGGAWMGIGQLAKAERAFRTAHRHAGDPASAALAKIRLAEICNQSGRYQQALRWATRGLKEVEAAEPMDHAAAARLCVLQGYIRHHQGRPALAMEWAQRAIDHAQEGGDRERVAMGRQLLDLVRITTGEFGSGEDTRAALGVWQELDNLTWQARALTQLGALSYFTGRWDEALGLYAQAAAIYDRTGADLTAAELHYNVAEIYTDQGHFEEAEALTRKALRAFRAADAPFQIATATMQLGVIAGRSTRFDEGMELMASARAMFDESGVRAAVVQVDCRMAEVLVLAGRRAEADGLIDQLLGTAGPAFAPLLHRLRGDLVASLDAARALGATYEQALALDALAAQLPDPDVVAERDLLFAQLGIISRSIDALHAP
jgi:class 3 adenylate cyclase/tetratricopeptide (TPR) repeat protein